MVVTHIRALLIVSLGCVVFGAPALSPCAPGRSKPSDIHQERAVCHPKGRSRTSAHLASLFSAATMSYSSTLHAEPKSRPIVAGPSSRHLHRHELGTLSPASRVRRDFLSAVNRPLVLSVEPFNS